MNDILDWSILEGWILTVYLKGDYEPEVTGFVHSYSSSMVFLSCQSEMGLDGFVLINRANISDIKIINRDFVATELMRRCDQSIEQVEVPTIDISSFQSVLEHFRETNELVCIRERLLAICEGDEDNDFYRLGRVVSVSNDKFEILEFDGVAVWEDKAYEVELEDMAQIEWSGVYLKTFQSFFDEFKIPKE